MNTLPLQNDGQYQHISEHLVRRFGPDELAAFRATLAQLVRDCPGFANVTKTLLAALDADGELWEWAVGPHNNADGRNAYAYGWCIVKDGQIISSLCHSTS